MKNNEKILGQINAFSKKKSFSILENNYKIKEISLKEYIQNT